MQEGGFTGWLIGVAHTETSMEQIIETAINRWTKIVGGETENKGASEMWIRVNCFISALRTPI